MHLHFIGPLNVIFSKKKRAEGRIQDVEGGGGKRLGARSAHHQRQVPVSWVQGPLNDDEFDD